MRIFHCFCLIHLCSLTTQAPAPAHTCTELDYISRAESDQFLHGLRSEDVPLKETSDELRKRQSGNQPPTEPLSGLSVSSSSSLGGPSPQQNLQGYGAVQQFPQHSGTLNERLFRGSFSDASAYAAQRTGEVSTRASRGICKVLKKCGAGLATYGPEFFRRLFTLNLDVADRNTPEGRREINKIALSNFVTFATILAIFSGTIYTVDRDARNRAKQNSTSGKRGDGPKSQAINFKIDWRDFSQSQTPIAVIRQYQRSPRLHFNKKILTTYLDDEGEFTVQGGKRVPASNGGKRDTSPEAVPPQISEELVQTIPNELLPDPSHGAPTNFSRDEYHKDLLKADALQEGLLTRDSTKLWRRDLRGATDCAPTNQFDFYKLLKHIWLAVIFPSLQSGETAIQVMLAGPASGSEYLLSNGGDVSLTVWVTEEADRETLLSRDPVNLTLLKSQDPKPLQHAECYSAGIPKGAGDKPTGPSISWWGSFFNICGAAFGSQTENMNPKDFLYAGQPQDPLEKNNGAGWYGKFVADRCTQKYSCEDLFGVLGYGQSGDAYTHVHQCLDKTPDHVYHGGVYYHQVPTPNGKGKVPCGYFVITPLTDYINTKATDLSL